MIPDEIMCRTDLTHLAKCVFGYMCRKAQGDRWSGGTRLLARLCGSGHQQVARAIKELETGQLVQVLCGRSGQRSSYLILGAAHIATLPKPKSGTHCDGASHIATEAAHIATRKRQRPPETKKKISSKPKSERIEQAERIWEAYPKKVGKQAAMPIIVEALRTTDVDTILAGVKRYAESVASEDQQFTKHPQGWFRAGRWADEVAAKKPRTGRAEAPEGKYGPENNDDLIQRLDADDAAAKGDRDGTS